MTGTEAKLANAASIEQYGKVLKSKGLHARAAWAFSQAAQDPRRTARHDGRRAAARRLIFGTSPRRGPRGSFSSSFQPLCSAIPRQLSVLPASSTISKVSAWLHPEPSFGVLSANALASSSVSTSTGHLSWT